MNKVKRKKIIDRINSIGGTIGIFLILLGIFNYLGKIEYLGFLLIIAGITLLIWRFFLEKKLK